jgi:rubrerythrin
MKRFEEMTFYELEKELLRLKNKENEMDILLNSKAKNVNGCKGDWGCPTCDRTINYEYPYCPYCGTKLKGYR